MTTLATISVLTPPGTGGVATLRVCAPMSLLVDTEHFRSRTKVNLLTLEVGRIIYGRWGQEDIVLCRVDEDHFEFHCHGGPAPQKRIIDDLKTHGVSQTSGWDVYATNQEAGPSWEQLLAAVSTEPQAIFVLQQRDNQAQIETTVKKTLANGHHDDAQALVEKSLNWFDYGQRRLRPQRVVLAGPPNVGKSSLINALLGFERAVVHEQAGTTRDIVTSTVSMNGYPIELSDTAGIRVADDEIEAEGVSRTRQRLTQADAILIVIDATNPDWETSSEIKTHYPQSIIVLNKIDDMNSTRELQLPIDVRVSAKAGTGLAELQSRLTETLFPVHPDITQYVPLTPTHVSQLKTFLQH